MRSAHHGDAGRPNVLSAAKILAATEPIDVYEIDFVTVGRQVISAHDYAISVIKKGSTLRQWVQFVVGIRGKRLWIDVKENWFPCLYERFDVDLLFRKLERLRLWAQKQWSLDLSSHVWIGCQSPEVLDDLCVCNQSLGGRWTVILDLPTISNYFWQSLPLVGDWLEEKVMAEALASDYEAYGVVAFDQSFFSSREQLRAFVESLRLAESTIVVLYNFPQDTPALKIDGHRVVMQYDYYG